MDKVLVVDDDRISRQGIIFLLNSMNYEFEIHEAANGQKALECLKNTEIDYLLTDIQMPFMDGLELIKEAYKICPELGTVIFSGYSLFDYAKKAITLGVQEYILKPVDPNEFYNSLNKLIDEKKQRLENQAMADFNENLINEHLLVSVTNGRNVASLAKQYPDMDVIGYLGKYKSLILIFFEDVFFASNAKLDFLDLTEIGFRYLNMNPSESLLFLEDDNKDKLIALGKSIITYIDVNFAKKCFIAVSIVKDNDFSSSIEELEDLMESRYYLPHTRILYHGDDIDREFKELELDKILENVKNNIRTQNIDKIRSDIHKYFKDYLECKNFSTEYFKFTFASVIREIAQSLPELTQQELNRRIVEYYHARNIKSIERVVGLFVDDLEKTIDNKLNLIHKEIETVQRYIYAHYSQDISVDMLADLVCLAPSYLSHIFKKETGVNLSKFIKSYRMERARDLLENSHEKIISISTSVGYPNVSYFCQSFRDYYGVSPQKFRNSGLINEND